MAAGRLGKIRFDLLDKENSRPGRACQPKPKTREALSLGLGSRICRDPCCRRHGCLEAPNNESRNALKKPKSNNRSVY